MAGRVQCEAMEESEGTVRKCGEPTTGELTFELRGLGEGLESGSARRWNKNMAGDCRRGRPSLGCATVCDLRRLLSA